MAQESRITSFEKALKDEGIAGTNLESVARSIFQQESSSGANVKTSNAGARGPMQVLPATFKAYNPQGNIDDPYDNSVGGLRYIKDLFSKTNDLGLTAVGYYGGPKAIEKAKQGVAVSDPRNPNAPNTLQYMEQVMGRTKGSQPQPAPRGNKPPVNPLIKQKITDLGPSYQAALALMAKADDLNEAREKIAEEEELASVGADFSQAKEMLAQIKPTSPFPAQEPRRMAKGGEAKTEEGLDPSLRFQSLDTPKDLEPGIMQQGPQGVMGRAGFNYQGEDSRFRAGASAIAVKLPDGSIKIIPAAYDVGYSTKVGPGELELSANRAIKAMPGRNPEWGARVNYRIPIGKAEGGEVEKKPEPSMGEKVKGTAKEILRSTQYTPYDLLGAPVDIINLGLKGVDYVTGSKLATEKPVGGSDYLIQKSRELGIADKPTGSTTETLTRLGTGIISPTAGPRAVAAAGQAVKGTAKAALEDLAMASTGQGGSKVAQQIMAPGTAFAVRPKGGVYLGAKSVDEPSLTRSDVYLQNVLAGVDASTEQGAAIKQFFDKKARSFIQNQYGTADDPVFKKILEGQIQPNQFYISPDKMQRYRETGSKQDLKAVRDAYDAETGVVALLNQEVSKAKGKGFSYKHQYQVEQDIKDLIAKQSPDNPTSLMTSVRPVDEQSIIEYPSLYDFPGIKQLVKEGDKKGIASLLNKSDLPPHIRQAITQGDPVYTNMLSMGGLKLGELKDYLSTRSPSEIKNMGFADALAKSSQWHEMLAKAKSNPEKFTKKELFAGTEPLTKAKDDYSWVDVKTKEALTIEGCIMGHCVGRLPSYLEGVVNGTKKIYSLRDKKGIPHVTIELNKTNQVPMYNWDGSVRKEVDPSKKDVFDEIVQIKGTANTPAESYFPQIDEFLTDYSNKIGDDLKFTELPRYLPENWRNK
ncbi:MAG: hypothetical protein EBU08_01270 [Micrococcales bacterium]|nr:hypothetical protein [Micrococcales bacterium]